MIGLTGYFIVAAIISAVGIGIVFYFTKNDFNDFMPGCLLSIAFGAIWGFMLPVGILILSFYVLFKLLNLIFNRKRVK